MSVKMIDYIVDAHHIEIDATILNYVKVELYSLKFQLHYIQEN